MTDTNKTSGADVLAVLGLADARTGSRALGHDGPDRDEWEEYAEVSMEKLAEFAALIERNAEIEAQTPSALREKLRSCEEALQAVEAERDALAAEVKALRVAAKRLLDAYDYSASAFEAAAAAEGVRTQIDAARASAATGGV